MIPSSPFSHSHTDSSIKLIKGNNYLSDFTLCPFFPGSKLCQLALGWLFRFWEGLFILKQRIRYVVLRMTDLLSWQCFILMGFEIITHIEVYV